MAVISTPSKRADASAAEAVLDRSILMVEGIGDITAVKPDDVGGKVWTREQIERLLRGAQAQTATATSDADSLYTPVFRECRYAIVGRLVR